MKRTGNRLLKTILAYGLVCCLGITGTAASLAGEVSLTDELFDAVYDAAQSETVTAPDTMDTAEAAEGMETAAAGLETTTVTDVSGGLDVLAGDILIPDAATDSSEGGDAGVQTGLPGTETVEIVDDIQDDLTEPGVGGDEANPTVSAAGETNAVDLTASADGETNAADLTASAAGETDAAGLTDPLNDEFDAASSVPTQSEDADREENAADDAADLEEQSSAAKDGDPEKQGEMAEEESELSDMTVSGEAEEDAAMLADNRIPVTSISMTTSTPVQAVFGQKVPIGDYAYDFKLSQGKPAMLEYGHWYKKVGSIWSKVDSGYFTAGTWRFQVCMWIPYVTIDGMGGTTHILTNSTKLTVNGTSWTRYGSATSSDKTSTLYFVSPSVTLTEPAGASLTFHYDDRTNLTGGMNISDSFLNQNIDTVDLAKFVTGGTKPYSFSKVSGPGWIKVSTEGIVSGKPTTTGTNSSLTLRVKDKDNRTAEVTVKVADSHPDSERRDTIMTVKATAEYLPPRYGQSVRNPMLSVIEGSPAWFAGYGSNSWWEHFEDGAWKRVDPSASLTFTDGKWRYNAQLRIDSTMVDGKNSDGYVLSKDTILIVNGTRFIKEYDNIHTTYSAVYYYSPIYEIKPNSVSVISGSADRTSAYEGQTVKIKADAPPEKMEFSHWNVLIGGKDTVPDPTKPELTVTMPGCPLRLEAVYRKWNVEKAVVTVSGGPFTFTGKAIKPSITVKYGSKTLNRGTDYTVWYGDNIEAGTARIVITGKGDYAGKQTKTFTIKKASITKATVKGLSAQVYTGSALTPAPAVKFGSVTLTGDKHYTLTWKNNVNVGPASVVIKGKGSLTGSVTKTFKINPKATWISKLTPKSDHRITVKWKKRTVQTDGYELQYSLDPTLKTGRKAKTFRDVNTTSFTTMKLKKGKTYYFRVRTFKKVDGTAYRSAWSKIKSVKAK